eukprot:120518_1
MCKCSYLANRSCPTNMLFAFILLGLAIMSVIFVPLVFIREIDSYQRTETLTLYQTQGEKPSILAQSNNTISNDDAHDKILFVSIVNYRENIMTENWILSMIRAGFQYNFRLITLDEMAFNRYSKFIRNTIGNAQDMNQYIYPIHDALPNENTFVDRGEKNNPKIAFHFNARSFKYLTCLRPVVIKHLLDKLTYSMDSIWNNYHGLVVIDVDSVMYKSRQAWHNKLKSYWNETVVFGSDLPGSLRCSCLIFIGDINPSKTNELNTFLDHWNKQCNASENRDDQTALETAIGQLPNVKYNKLFDINEFPNGHKYKWTEWLNKYMSNETLDTYGEMTQQQIDNNTLFPYMIHSNWMQNNGGYTKIKFLKRFKAWLISDDRTQAEIGKKLWD